MEDKKSKVKMFLEDFPHWAQLAITLGTGVWGLAIMYNNVQTLSVQVDKFGDVAVQQVKMSAELDELHQQILSGQDAQKQTNDSVNKLSDAVNKLDSSVSRLEGLSLL